VSDVEGPDQPPVEVEAKFLASERAFRLLREPSTIAGWEVDRRRDVRLRDIYWETPDYRLLRAGYNLRVRQMDELPEAELTLKGPVERGSGMSGSRAEWTAHVPAGSGPTDWQYLTEAAPIANILRVVGVFDPPRGGTELRPELVLLNPRHEMVLRLGANIAVLSLDEVTIEGEPYRRRYVEIELEQGSRQALDELAQSVAHRFGLRPSQQGKVQAARRWRSESAS
jgi:triphosphatase